VIDYMHQTNFLITSFFPRLLRTELNMTSSNLSIALIITLKLLSRGYPFNLDHISSRRY
jgi:hypothetical protein